MSLVSVSQFKYLVVNSGYTGRLTKKVDKLNKKIVEDVYCNIVDYDQSWRETSVLYITDTLHGKGTYKYGNAADINIIKNHVKIAIPNRKERSGGVIAFRCEYISDALRIVKVLKDMRYCACLEVECIFNIRCVDNTTLVIDVDCESG